MIIDGKKIAQDIKDSLKEKISHLSAKPSLAFILIGDNAASQTYVRMKKKACEHVGITSYVLQLPSSISENELLFEIEKFNLDPAIDALIVQLPLPSHINPHKITEAINPLKDVDGFHPLNVGKMLLGDPTALLPCTPNGIKILLAKSKIEVASKHVVILGRSNIVGKPLAAILVQKAPHCDATVTIAHSGTKDLHSLTKTADILVAAIGKAHFVTADMIKEGAVVIDVGINRLPSKQIVGDVDFASVAPKASHITPVPGGVGPMTIAMLLENTYTCYKLRQKKS